MVRNQDDAVLEASPVSVRLKISALWVTMLFVFAYVDVFSLYRPDVRSGLEAGELGGFTVGQPFLIAALVYIAIPSLMVFATMVMRPRPNRLANVVLAVVYALSIMAGAIGEWGYYVLGSAIEVALLAGVAYYALTWPRSEPGQRDSVLETPTPGAARA